MGNVSCKSCGEDQNTRFMFDDFLFEYPTVYRLSDNVEKYGTAEWATDDNMANALSIMGT
jgi:hypothetical protein